MATEIELRPLKYNTVAASQTAQVLNRATADGGTGNGAVGDILEYVTVIPASTSPGAVTLIDGATSITIFAGGASSVGDLKPFTIMWGARSLNGPYKITTGTSVSLSAFGRFT